MRWVPPPLVRNDTIDIIEKCKGDLEASYNRRVALSKTVRQTRVRFIEAKKLLARIDAELVRSPLKP